MLVSEAFENNFFLGGKNEKKNVHSARLYVSNRLTGIRKWG
jgi:hypothetical protein